MSDVITCECIKDASIIKVIEKMITVYACIKCGKETSVGAKPYLVCRHGGIIEDGLKRDHACDYARFYGLHNAHSAVELMEVSRRKYLQGLLKENRKWNLRRDGGT